MNDQKYEGKPILLFCQSDEGVTKLAVGKVATIEPGIGITIVYSDGDPFLCLRMNGSPQLRNSVNLCPSELDEEYFNITMKWIRQGVISSKLFQKELLDAALRYNHKNPITVRRISHDDCAFGA